MACSGDCINGYGTFIYENGDKCVGEWKNALSHGLATLTFGKGKWEGDKYTGEWENDKKHGFGTYTHANGNRYAGEYKYNKKDGFGTYIWINGDIIEMNTIRGRSGTYTWNDG